MMERDGVQIAFVRGDLRERAGQLAEQLAEQLAPTVTEGMGELQFWQQVDRYICQGQLPTASSKAINGALRLFRQLAVAPLYARVDDDMRAALSTFSEVVERDANGTVPPFMTQAPPASLAHAHVIQDALAVMTGQPWTTKAPAGPLGCSSLVALPDLTQSGEVIMGRNFDLMPHGSAVPPLLVVHRPHRGLAHVSLHHGGGFTPGITAVNEAGLVMAVHQNFTRAVSLSGRPLLSVTREVIETCRSMSDALEKLRRTKTAGGWTFVLADSKRGRACAVEIDAEGSASLFPPRDFLAVANCYRTRKKVHDFAFSGAWREHNWSRLSLLNRSARRARGYCDVMDMAAALADHTDAYDHSRQRAFGNTVSAIHNVDAAIFAPGLDALYVAAGRTPRNSSNGYAGFSLSALLDGRIDPLKSLAPVVEGSFREALYKHSDASRLLFEGGDVEHAEALFEQAADLVPDEPIYRFMQGVLQLKAGEADTAADTFASCVEDETSPYRRGLGRLMEGRALDVLGHRREARAAYADVSPQAENVDPGLLRRAERGRVKAFAPGQVKRLIIDTLLADIPG